MGNFRKISRLVYEIVAGVCTALMVIATSMLIALALLFDPGTTAEELEEAQGRCAIFLKDQQDARRGR